jgi:hypothetical protein
MTTSHAFWRRGYLALIVVVGCAGSAHGQDWSQAFTNNCLLLNRLTDTVTNTCPPPAPRYFAAMAGLPSGFLPGATTLLSGGVAMFGGAVCPTPAPCDPSMTHLSDDLWVWVGSHSLTSQSWVNANLLSPVKNMPRPSPRAGAMMALDESRNELVLFGGYGIPPGETAPRDLDDTWVFTWTNGWQQILDIHGLPPTPRPAARDDGAMSFTPNRIVLFGGYAPSFMGSVGSGIETLVWHGIANDTWVWHGDTRSWTQVPTTDILDDPFPRYGARLVPFSAASTDVRSATLLFGGFGFTYCPGCVVHYFRDYYEFLVDAWTFTPFPSEAALPPPSPRAEYAMAAYGAVSRPFPILFGGENGVQRFGDTWAVDYWYWTHEPPDPCGGWSPGNAYAWKQVCPPHSPSARSYHSMAYSQPDGQIVLFGGWDSTGKIIGGTWLWGPRTSCTPDPSALLKIGAAIECTFSPIEGAHFDGWETDGFTGSTGKDATKFHPTGPGPASVTAVWTDANGDQHRNALHYNVAVPADMHEPGQ